MLNHQEKKEVNQENQKNKLIDLSVNITYIYLNNLSFFHYIYITLV